MTARKRITLSQDKISALAAERRNIALRRAAAEISDRLPLDKLERLIGNLVLVDDMSVLIAALRKAARARVKQTPDIGGEARPDPAIWATGTAR